MPKYEIIRPSMFIETQKVVEIISLDVVTTSDGVLQKTITYLNKQISPVVGHKYCIVKLEDGSKISALEPTNSPIKVGDEIFYDVGVDEYAKFNPEMPLPNNNKLVLIA